ncbi:MAG TPA: helix-turn-helix domain-containing protein [Solirubrobacteraceae bacterium]|nr:helix-turn-helix domain-containing protein [Solirubrobacteraceae bacterium]
MFVSELRAAVAKLLDAGLSKNEIAHRLGVARSTVGYHAERLGDEKGRPSEQHGSSSRRRPVAAVAVTREQVRQLLASGKTRAEVARALGLSRSTVTYHAARLGEDIDSSCGRRYDWHQIRRFYDEGHSLRACQARFGFNMRTWHDAIHRGAIVARPTRMPLDRLLVAGPRRNRGHLKQRLFDAGLKERRCETCGLNEWRGRPIPLSLHHVNGERHDNRLANLQILCANCHGQTDNWAGRNLVRRRKPATRP